MRERMATLDINQAELARRVNAARTRRRVPPVTHAAISITLNQKTTHTRLMPDINDVLGGERPKMPSPDSEVATVLRERIIAGIERLDEKQRALIAEVVESLVRK